MNMKSDQLMYMHTPKELKYPTLQNLTGLDASGFNSYGCFSKEIFYDAEHMLVTTK